VVLQHGNGGRPRSGRGGVTLVVTAQPRLGSTHAGMGCSGQAMRPRDGGPSRGHGSSQQRGYSKRTMARRGARQGEGSSSAMA
jgi:hypothetical protein